MNTSEAYRNIKWLHLRCGDRVCRTDDERHVGVVQAITNSVVVHVRWDTTRWLEYVHANELRKETETERAANWRLVETRKETET